LADVCHDYDEEDILLYSVGASPSSSVFFDDIFELNPETGVVAVGDLAS